MNSLTCSKTLCAILCNSLHCHLCYREKGVWGWYNIYKKADVLRVNFQIPIKGVVAESNHWQVKQWIKDFPYGGSVTYYLTNFLENCMKVKKAWVWPLCANGSQGPSNIGLTAETVQQIILSQIIEFPSLTCFPF